MVSTYRTWKNYRSDRTACLLMKNNFAALRHSSSFPLLHHHPACLFLYADPSSSSSNSGCFGGSIALFCFVFALRSLHIIIITHFSTVRKKEPNPKRPHHFSSRTYRKTYQNTKKHLSYYSSQERNKQAKKQKSPFLVLLSLSVFQSKKSEVVVVNPIYSLSLSLSLSLYLSRRRVFWKILVPLTKKYSRKEKRFFFFFLALLFTW